MSTQDQTGAVISTSSSLSVNAAEFVPSKLCQNNSSAVDGTPQTKVHAGGIGKSLVEVPPYMTNCYPFVTQSAGQRLKQSNDLHKAIGARPFVPALSPGGNVRHFRPCSYHANFNPAVRFPTNSQPWIPSLHPVPSSIVGPVPGRFHMPFDGGTCGDGLLPTPPFPPLGMHGITNPTSLIVTDNVQYSTASPLTPGHAFYSDRADKPGLLGVKKMGTFTSRGRKGTGHRNKVSIGTQNEMPSVLTQRQWNHHTIIMRDISVQTDFNKDIADLTLSEKPNSLFHRGQKKNKGSQPHTINTDSEEVDSDSGYSSPLHRKNLVSNGTQPFRIGALVEATEPAKKVTSSNIHSVPLGSAIVGVCVSGLEGLQPSTISLEDDWVPINTTRTSFNEAKPPVVVSIKGIIKSGMNAKDISRLPSNIDDVQKLDKRDGTKPVCVKDIQKSEIRESSKPGTVLETSQRIAGNVGKDTLGSHIAKPPEFPVLKPARRNEPPWSLTPKPKVTDISLSERAGPAPVKSYASIVKSVSSPVAPTNSYASVVSSPKQAASRTDLCEYSEQNCDNNIQQIVAEGTAGRRQIISLAEIHSVDSVLKTISSLQQQDSKEGQTPQSEDDKKSEGDGKKKRRHRRRKRRRRNTKNSDEILSDGLSGMERTVSSSNISRTSDVTLHFEDETEFPEIGASSSVEVHSFKRVESSSSLSYSDVLKGRPGAYDVRSRTQSAPGSCLSGEEGGDENFNSQPGQCSTGHLPESKRVRKRKKRRELANRAAEAELAEISLEQQMLREFGQKSSGRNSRPSSGSRDGKSPSRGLIIDPDIVKQSKTPSQNSSGKKLHQPIALSIADMLDAFEKKKTLAQSNTTLKKTQTKDDRKLNPNVLDCSAPTVKRGKEREMPKPKKPSPLKKVILKEREEKKRMRLIGDCDIYPGVDDVVDDDDISVNPGSELLEENNSGNPVGLGESDLSQDGMSSRSMDTDQGVSPGADLSPISQTSPLSMSPLTPGASPINSPIAGYLGRDPVVLRIHSRRFREYCTQILDKDIDTCCTSLLHELVRFQDRMYHKDPVKAKSKRRIVLGLREVTKHLKLKKIKCVVISPNLEKIQSKGGLDEALNNILNMCQEQNVPFVFALGRRALGRACAKLVPVSVAGIFNYEGCEEKFNQLISLTHKGREAYSDMVKAIEQEIAENPPPAPLSASSSVPSLYAHMGHSRTPSGCSAISFTSSILSEPISENYPHAEPETDSKGYEIVRDRAGNVVNDGVLSSSKSDSQNSSGLGIYVSAADEIDDGNEADTEDFGDIPQRKKTGSIGDMGGKNGEKNLEKSGIAVNCPENDDEESVKDVDDDRKEIDEDDESNSDDNSQQDALPPIDSIHSSTYDLSTELLSQHSSRTIENIEVLSTHSSKTVGESSLGPSCLDRVKEGARTPDSMHSSNRVRLLDKDRIHTWLESTQLCLEEERGQLGGKGVNCVHEIDEDEEESDHKDSE